MSTLHLGFGGPLPKWPREAASRGPIAEGERETFVFLMLNELAKSGQVNAHNFQYETVALARECESFVKGSDWSRSTFSTLYRRVKEHVAGQYGRGQGDEAARLAHSDHSVCI